MSYVVLARKYRPKNFSEMMGQETVVRALTGALERQRLHHAYLFTGTRGVGKTTVSRILAKSLNCIGPQGDGGITAAPCGVCPVCTAIDADRYVDYVEMDGASNRSLDEIRDLLERAAYKPSLGRFKVFMIDEAHQLTKDAFNALLKTLEEPPEYLKFVLATTDPEKMLPTVLSRCLQFNLRPIAPEVVAAHLQRVLHDEGITADAGALDLLARAARGSMRDALSLTDQAIAFGGGVLRADAVRQMLGLVDQSYIQWMWEALARRDVAGLMQRITELKTHGSSAMGALDGLVTLTQALALEQAVPGSIVNHPLISQAPAAQLAQCFTHQETHLLYNMLMTGRSELVHAPDEHDGLLMILLRFLAFVRSDAKPVVVVPQPPEVTPEPLPAPMPEPVVIAVAPSASDIDWAQTVENLLQAQAVTGMVRELAVQSECVAQQNHPDEGRVLQLTVAKEALAATPLAEKLGMALQPLFNQPVRIQVKVGAVQHSYSLRQQAQQNERMQQAQQAIESDPLIQNLLQEYPDARIVPGSIQPI
jgi:DNA polymerase-3 subunit gamma/tau